MCSRICSYSDHVNRMKKIRNVLPFHNMPLALANERKESCDKFSFVIKSSYLKSFFLFFLFLVSGVGS